MCETCSKFVAVDIKTNQQLEDLRTRLFFSGLKTGALAIVVGDLQPADYMECILRCTACGQRFELSFCRGGAFGPIDPLKNG